MRPALISIGLGVLAIAAGAPDAGAALIAGSQDFAMANFVRHTQVQESAADQAARQLSRTQPANPARGLIDFFNRELRPVRIPDAPRAALHDDAPVHLGSRRSAARARRARPHHDAADTRRKSAPLPLHASQAGRLHAHRKARRLARYPLRDTSAPARYARAVAYYRVSDLPRARGELEHADRRRSAQSVFPGADGPDPVRERPRRGS